MKLRRGSGRSRDRASSPYIKSSDVHSLLPSPDVQQADKPTRRMELNTATWQQSGRPPKSCETKEEFEAESTETIGPSHTPLIQAIRVASQPAGADTSRQGDRTVIRYTRSASGSPMLFFPVGRHTPAICLHVRADDQREITGSNSTCNASRYHLF